jgi:hypothetical protein
MKRECRVPFCHRKPWGNLQSCQKHTLYSRAAMQKRRDREKARALMHLDGAVAAILSKQGIRGEWAYGIGRKIIAKVTAHLAKTRRRRTGP